MIDSGDFLAYSALAHKSTLACFASGEGSGAAESTTEITNIYNGKMEKFVPTWNSITLVYQT